MTSRNLAEWAGLTPPYRTIVADPPWPDRRKGNIAPTRVGRVLKDRSIRAQYNTMSIDEITSLPVADLATDDAHLYLWTTNLDMHDALHVVEAWGFRYITAVTWVKTGHLGMGYHFRTMTEHILFGVKGKLRTQDRGQRNHFTAAKAGHSVKPDAAYDFIEQASPGPYLDLFARRVRAGWDGWGDGYQEGGSMSYRAICNDCEWASPWCDDGLGHVLGDITPSQRAVLHAQDTSHTWRIEAAP